MLENVLKYTRANFDECLLASWNILSYVATHFPPVYFQYSVLQEYCTEVFFTLRILYFQDAVLSEYFTFSILYFQYSILSECCVFSMLYFQYTVFQCTVLSVYCILCILHFSILYFQYTVFLLSLPCLSVIHVSISVFYEMEISTMARQTTDRKVESKPLAIMLMTTAKHVLPHSVYS